MRDSGANGVLLELQKRYVNGYSPGDTFAALLHVRPALDPSGAKGLHHEAVFDVEHHLDEITTEFKGIERVDTSWVSKSYRKHVTQINSDPRRVQRCVVEGKFRAGTRGDFGEDACRVFLIRFTIPDWIPPTFSGIVARYSYYIDISVKYTVLGLDERPSEQIVKLRDILHVWPHPLTESELQGTASAFRGSKVTARLHDANEEHSCVEIKCWEVAFGTTIDDAVENVELLRQESQISTPYSPAYQGERLSRTTSLDTRHDPSPSEMLKKRLFEKYQGPSPEDMQEMLVKVLPEPTENAELVRNDSGSKSPLSNPISERRRRYFDGLSESASNFRLRIEDIIFARIHLHSSGDQEPLSPGKSLVGTIEFTENPSLIRCLKYVVALEIEEQIDEDWISKGKSASLGGRLHQTVEESIHLSPDTVSSCFYFTLPANATPDFKTDLMSLRWGLRFYFYMTIRNQKSVKTLEWKIPLKIRPPM